MNVFLSWSGPKSKQVAEALRNWIPGVLQAVRPYFSDEDLQPGKQWTPALAAQLESTDVGLICMTSENLDAPWLMFEAGALAKRLDTARVIPLLLDVEASDIRGPLAQFQLVKFEEKKFRDVMDVINASLGERALPMNVLDGVFKKWWPDLLQQISAIKAQASSSPQPQKRSTESILEEILTLVRGLGSGTRFTPKELLAMDLARQQTMHAIAVAAVEEMALSAMNIRPAIVEMLDAARINTLGELLKRSEDELLRLSPAMGLEALDQIKEALAIHGLALKKPEN
jgi:hypothetical protein